MAQVMKAKINVVLNDAGGNTIVTAKYKKVYYSGTTAEWRLAGDGAGDDPGVAVTITLTQQAQSGFDTDYYNYDGDIITTYTYSLYIDVGAGEVLQDNQEGVMLIGMDLVEDVTEKAPIANPTFTGEIGIGAINVSETELGILEGATVTTAELNKLDGFTGVVADLNYAKDLKATGVTTSEFDILDGLTATVVELNKLDGFSGVVADLELLAGAVAAGLSAAELLYVKAVTSDIQTQIDTMATDSGIVDTLAAGGTNATKVIRAISALIGDDTAVGRMLAANKQDYVSHLGTPAAKGDAPEYTGQLFLDITNGAWYKAINTTEAASFKKLTP